MKQNGLRDIVEHKCLPSPTTTPQALAYEDGCLWMSSRDLGTLCKIHPDTWKVAQEIDPPGVVWAAVAAGPGEMYFTVGKGLNDDRYIYRYATNEGFTKLFACPDFTGSYLGFDGKHLYMSQWYKERILRFDARGNILSEINVGEEICGYTFLDGIIYVLRGRENKNQPDKSEEWRIARLDPRENSLEVQDLAVVPFAARSLTFDGQHFWSNHRAANETISFSLPQ
jgi:hypothetical protein